MKMAPKKYKFYKPLTDSYKVFKDIPFIAKSALVDIAFFAVFAVVYTFFSLKIVDILNSVNIIISEMSSSMPADSSVPTQESMLALASQKEVFMQNFRELAILFLLLMLCTYLLWCIFQGMSWWLAHKKAGNKMPFLGYLGRFSLLSLLWAVVFLIISFVVIKYSDIINIANIEVVNAEMLAAVLGIILAVVLYFAFVSYSIAEKKLLSLLKMTFLDGIKKAKYYAPIYLLMLAKMFVAVEVILLLSLDIIATVLIGLVVVVMILMWGRMGFVLVRDYKN